MTRLESEVYRLFKAEILFKGAESFKAELKKINEMKSYEEKLKAYEENIGSIVAYSLLEACIKHVDMLNDKILELHESCRMKDQEIKRLQTENTILRTKIEMEALKVAPTV